MARPKGSKNKVVVLDKTNIESVLKQMNDIEFPYKVILKVGIRVLEATGNTIREALLKFNLRGNKGKGVLTVQKGDIKKEKILQPIIMYRLLNTTGLSNDICVKNICLMFGDF